MQQGIKIKGRVHCFCWMTIVSEVIVHITSYKHHKQPERQILFFPLSGSSGKTWALLSGPNTCSVGMAFMPQTSNPSGTQGWSHKHPSPLTVCFYFFYSSLEKASQFEHIIQYSLVMFLYDRKPVKISCCNIKCHLKEYRCWIWAD